jgi:lipopolysaccharide transport system ATP-binding protein
MSDVAIRCEGLSKQYRIGKQERYKALRDTLTDAVYAPFRRVRSLFNRDKASSDNQTDSTFWALDDVSFEVKQGEVVGVIGRNGAGKSTLLKILSRITEPTRGHAEIHGRVGSLLEVGTGFNPELTGRENIFLNGAILGMKRAEIIRKFDEIVAFAEIEKFLDTPVKHYSSGMYVRLAFAVAAHLEPEILLVDEVLAVGDLAFQKKCIGKMGDVAKEGRAILFVSHNMGAIGSLCGKGIVLNKGEVAFEGNIQDAVNLYCTDSLLKKQTEWIGDEGDENARLLRVWTRSLDSDGTFHTTADIEVGMEIDVLRPIIGLVWGFTLYSEFGYELAYVLYDDDKPPPTETLQAGKLKHLFVIPSHTLAEGAYRIEVDLGIHMVKKIIGNVSLSFTLENIDGPGRRIITPYLRGRRSLFRPAWTKGTN